MENVRNVLIFQKPSLQVSYSYIQYLLCTIIVKYVTGALTMQLAGILAK